MIVEKGFRSTIDHSEGFELIQGKMDGVSIESERGKPSVITFTHVTKIHLPFFHTLDFLRRVPRLFF